MNFEDLKNDFENLDIPFDDVENLTVKEVIKAYRKQALKVHPDKQSPDVTDEEKARFNALFQELNMSYKILLKVAMENDAKKSINDIQKVDEEADVKFMKDNFENFNFPHENNGSFTVIIQDHLADSWQECLENIFGQPTIKKNPRGTVCDTYWKIFYD